MMQFGQGGKKDEASDEPARRLSAALGSRSVVLVGMPGCGKSAVGRRLAPRLGIPFVDADEEIERAAGKPITDIFKDHGEPYFRDGERARDRPSARRRPTGAGDRRRRVHEWPRRATTSADSGISVWLKAELPLLMRRVLKKNNRPLLMNDPEASMKRLMTIRYPVYATADITVESREVPHEVDRRRGDECVDRAPHAEGRRGCGAEPGRGDMSFGKPLATLGRA